MKRLIPNLVFGRKTAEFSKNAKIIATLFCLVVASSASGLNANPASQARQNLEEIRQAAKKFLEEKPIAADKGNIEVAVGDIDRRLKLAKCDQMQVFLPQRARELGKVTVGVKCLSPVNWKIFIPTQVTLYQQAWVSTRNLGTRDILNREDLVLQKVAVKDGRKVPVTDLAQLLNTSPKKPIRVGAPLYQGSVCLVCRGDKVSVKAGNQWLTIDVEGTAMADAVLGEKVQVRNSDSKKVFAAVVTAKDQLTVNITGNR